MINNLNFPLTIAPVVVIGLKFVSLQDDKQQTKDLFEVLQSCDWIKIRIFAR